MKKKYFNNLYNIILLSIFSIIFSACAETWVMYDTDQKDHLLFEKPTGHKTSVPFFSLTFFQDNVVEYKIPIFLMGMPSDKDRTFAVELIEDTTKTVKVGDVEREVVNAIIGEDVEFSDVYFPANKVKTELTVKVHRNSKMVSKAVALYLRVKENDNFAPLASDSYKVYITDGEPSCPTWWIIEYKGVVYQWHMYVGKFTSEKYRKFLEYYWDMERTNPLFYYAQEEKYGKYLDKKLPNSVTGELTEDIKHGFFQSDNPTVWASYVLCPLFDYYVENYPDEEEYTTGNVATATGGWKDPITLYR